MKQRVKRRHWRYLWFGAGGLLLILVASLFAQVIVQPYTSQIGIYLAMASFVAPFLLFVVAVRDHRTEHAVLWFVLWFGTALACFMFGVTMLSLQGWTLTQYAAF